MISPRVIDLGDKLGLVLDTCVRPLFVPGVKLTIAARFDGFPERDVLVTDDSIEEIAALLDRSKKRPTYGGPSAPEAEGRKEGES